MNKTDINREREEKKKKNNLKDKFTIKKGRI